MISYITIVNPFPLPHIGRTEDTMVDNNLFKKVHYAQGGMMQDLAKAASRRPRAWTDLTPEERHERLMRNGAAPPRLHLVVSR